MTRKGSPVGDLSGFDEDGKLIAGFDVQQDQIASSARTSADNCSPVVGLVQLAFQRQSQVRATVSGEAELIEAWTMRGEDACLRRVADSFVHQGFGEDEFGLIHRALSGREGDDPGAVGGGRQFFGADRGDPRIFRWIWYRCIGQRDHCQYQHRPHHHDGKKWCGSDGFPARSS